MNIYTQLFHFFHLEFYITSYHLFYFISVMLKKVILVFVVHYLFTFSITYDLKHKKTHNFEKHKRPKV